MIIKNIKNKHKDYTNKNATKSVTEYITNKALQNITQYTSSKSQKVFYINLPNDQELAIKKMQNTQSYNTKTKASKIYHYIISFKEGEKPSDQTLTEIEQAISQKLGFNQHQRVLAIHDDTAHYHMHVVINKIHPTTHNNLSPSFDHYKMDSIAQELEQKYNLQQDNRINYQQRTNKNHKAIDFEKHTGIQSFTAYLQTEIKQQALQAKNWQQLHEQARQIGVIIKLQGNGLVFKNIDSKETVKASTIDRQLSKSKLEQKLGYFIEYQPEQSIKNAVNVKQCLQNDKDIQNPIQPQNNALQNDLEPSKNQHIQKNYTKAPVHKNSNELWQNYQKLEAEKVQQQKNQLQIAKQNYSQQLEQIKQLKKQQKEYLKTSGIKYQNTINLNLNIDLKATQTQEQAYQQYKQKRSKIYQQTKKTTWLEYLMAEAKTNSQALKVLQSNLKTQEYNQITKQQQPANKIQSMEFLKQNNQYLGYGIIAKNGEIHYKTIDNGYFKASKDGIYIVKDSLEARNQALEIAQKSYGKNLKVQGSQEFIQQIKNQAKEKQLSINDNQLER